MATDDVAPEGLLDDYPGVDNRSCQLLGPTALVNIFSLAPRIPDSYDRVDCPRPHGSPCYSVPRVQAAMGDAKTTVADMVRPG